MTFEDVKRIRKNPIAESCDILELHNLIDIAIEKQIPKKPIYVDTRFRNHGRHISDGSSLDKCYKCPNCNSHIFHIFDGEKCCVHCGQALDWGDS